MDAPGPSHRVRREDLAKGQIAERPNIKPPEIERGTEFLYQDLEDRFNIFEDEREEVFDEDTYVMFETYKPRDTSMRAVDEKWNPEVKHDLHDPVDYNWDMLALEMEKVNLDGTIKKLVIKEGNGVPCPPRCRLYFHYTAFLETEEEPFDSSLSRKYPHSVDLRDDRDSLIPGLRDCVRNMEIGETARFLLEPKRAYGVYGSPPRVPPNTRVLYIVETLQYIEEERLNSPLYMSTEERNALDFETIYELSHHLRRQGNGLYVKGMYQPALRSWRKGITLIEDYSANVSEDIIKDRQSMLGSLYANLAQAYLKLEKPAAVCSACKFGLRLMEDDISLYAPKLMYRFARAKIILNHFDTAEKMCDRMIYQLPPQHPDLPAFRKLREEVKELKRLKLEDEKEFCMRMLGRKSASYIPNDDPPE